MIAAERSQNAQRFITVCPPDSDSATQEEQIQAQNRFWRIQLSRLKKNTIDERECLADDVGYQAWLRDFRKGVLPTILEYNLPY